MMNPDPFGMPPPPRVPRVTVGQLAEQLAQEDQDALVRLLAPGARECYAKGILVVDRDGNVVIC